MLVRCWRCFGVVKGIVALGHDHMLAFMSGKNMLARCLADEAHRWKLRNGHLAYHVLYDVA